jgi:hypothetical protein
MVIAFHSSLELQELKFPYHMNINLRKLHRKVAPVLFLPLFLSAITGIGYRIGKS